MKNLLIGIAIMVLGVGAYMYMQNTDATADSVQDTTTMSQEVETQNDATSVEGTADTAMDSGTVMEDGTLVAEVSTTTIAYTMAEVAKHNNESSCWSVIDGNVYDLTSWISKHPGGERNILKICGIDGTSAFNSEHGKDAKAQVKRDEFLLGALTE